METNQSKTSENKPAPVKMTLVGVDGNAYAVMGVFQRNARRQGWTQEQIKVVLDEAMSDDYDHLLATILDNIEEPEEDNDES